MRVVYMSITGNTRKYVNKLGVQSLELSPTNPFIKVDYDYILIAPTYDIEVTEILEDFLETGNNLERCKGVFGGGNLNFAQLYVFTAKDICKKYGLKLLHSFEFTGNKKDVERFKEEVENIVRA